LFSRHTLLAPGGGVAHTRDMGRPPNPDIVEKDLRGFKHFKLLLPVLEKLRPHR